MRLIIKDAGNGTVRDILEFDMTKRGNFPTFVMRRLVLAVKDGHTVYLEQHRRKSDRDRNFPET